MRKKTDYVNVDDILVAIQMPAAASLNIYSI